jgi:hypothetical protein
VVRGRLDVFVAKALSPAQVIEVRIDEEHRIANVVVPERMLSLAIGREGQNARLAAKLTGWRIDIRSDVSVAEAARGEAEVMPPKRRSERAAGCRGRSEAAPVEASEPPQAAIAERHRPKEARSPKSLPEDAGGPPASGKRRSCEPAKPPSRNAARRSRRKPPKRQTEVSS